MFDFDYLIEGYYTETDKAHLADMEKSRQEINAIDFELAEKLAAAREANDREAFNQIKKKRNENLNGIFAISTCRQELLFAAKMRYCKSRCGNVEAILKDAALILNTISKDHYMEYYYTAKAAYESNKRAVEGKPIDAKTKAAIEQGHVKRGWNSCVDYLKYCLTHQYNALVYSTLGELRPPKETECIEGANDLTAMIEARASEFYTRPRRNAAKKKSTPPIEHTLLDDIYYTPNSDAAYRLVDAVANGSKNKEVYLNMLKHTNPNYDYSAVEVTHDLVTGVAGVAGVEKVPFNQYTIQKGNQKIVIELVMLGALSKVSPYAAKMLVFILAKINRQASNVKGELTRNYITFTLQELVDLKMYSDVRSARAAFWNIMPVLRHVSIYGFLMADKDGKDTVAVGEKKDSTPLSGKGGGIIGTFGIEPDGRTCKVYLEEGADWKLLLKFYAALPTFYFELSSLAASIVLYATHLARIRAKDIKKADTQQVVSLSLEALRERLMLPDMEGNKKRYETIRKPIEDAIDEIEQAQERAIKEHPDQTDLADMTFSFKRSDTSKRDTTQDFLNSTLEVTIKGRLFEYNKAQSTKRIAHKATNKRLKEQARAKALTDAETKHIKAQQAAATDHPDTKTDNAAGALEGSKPHEEHEQTGATGAGDSDSLPRD